jgi:hypothetical protein
LNDAQCNPHVGSGENATFRLAEEKLERQYSRVHQHTNRFPPPEKLLRSQCYGDPLAQNLGMPIEYYRAQAARVRNLAQDATTDAVREHLAAVALQYEMLADGAAAATRDPQ